MPARSVAFALVLPAVALVAGCGNAGRATDATAVARDFQVAVGGEDGDAACGQLGDATRSNLESDEGKPCAEAILDLDLPTGTDVDRARVSVDSAAVAGPGGATLFLDEVSGDWEVSAAGCRPTEPDQPLDCELED